MPIHQCTVNGEKGWKWGGSGECYPGESGKRKAEKQAEAAYASGYKGDSEITFDSSISFKPKIDKITGFLTAPVTLARVGVQHYLGLEIGLMDRAKEKIGVLRPANEVFHPDSINSFINLVVTNDHPNGPVTIDNVKQLQVGTVSEVDKKDDSTLSGILTITDKKIIGKTKGGKKEVSVGYANTLVDEVGEYEGQKYEFKQTKIRANHLAIVDAGRCGSACQITTDHNKRRKTMIKITIDGITFDTEDEQLAQAITNRQALHDAEKEEMKEQFKKKSEMDQEELEKMKKEKDKAAAEKDAAIASSISDADLSKLINDRAILIIDAREILGDAMPKCTDCPMEIKTAVVESVLSDMDLTEKSDDYVTAAYDMAVAKFKKAGESIKKLSNDFLTNDKGEKITRESARAAYMKDQLGNGGIIMPVQTAYTAEHLPGFEGQRVDLTLFNVTSKVSEVGSVPFGRAVVRGTGDDGANLPTASGQAFVGITELTSAFTVDYDGTHQYHQYQEMNVVDFGEIYVYTEQSVIPGDVVYFRHTAGTSPLDVVGRFRKDSSGGDADLIQGASFETTTAAGGIAKVKLNTPGVGILVPVDSSDVMIAAGAVSLATAITYLETVGAIAITLADGVAGQQKIIKMTVDGGTATLTPANLSDGTTLAFADVNDSVVLRFDGTNWGIISNNGTTLA